MGSKEANLTYHLGINVVDYQSYFFGQVRSFYIDNLKLKWGDSQADWYFKLSGKKRYLQTSSVILGVFWNLWEHIGLHQ